MNINERRQGLQAAGYTPIPLYGKAPPNTKNNKRKSMTRWEQTNGVTTEMIKMWGKVWPDAVNTGLLTRSMPTLDLDILNEAAARAAEDYVRERFEERGNVLTRIGKPPKRAIPFRTEEPFGKFVVNLVAANGGEEKIELLADGGQVVAFGIHPDTKEPYRWFGGAPGKVKREDLPYIREDEARQLVDDIVDLLCRDFGYIRAKGRPRKRTGNGKADSVEEPETASADWQYLIDNIMAGRELHASLRDLAGKMIKSGMNAGAAVNQLRALLQASSAARDDRWKDRFDDIPRLVHGAEDLTERSEIETPAKKVPKGPPSTIEQTLKVFDRWLILTDHTPVLAVLGAVAANYLDGDPIWLGVIAPPSSAKTEILNAVSALPDVAQVATITPAGLLSGTPKRQQDKGAKGGLLRRIGDFGIVVLKDFGSILSMHAETKAEILAALREVYDGAWTRVVGTDGGKALSWQGKVGLIFAATEVIDSHYAVIGQMGDRFLLSRLAPASGRVQFKRALDHTGAATKQMRGELAEAVARLFSGRAAQPRPLSDEEAERIGTTISLVVRLRGAVVRERYKHEIDAVYGAEGTARIGLALERLVAGLDTLGVDRAAALNVALSVAMDSVPPQRRRAYETVCKYGDVETADVAIELGLPTNTARRVLEDLAAHRLVTRHSLGQGKADHWVRNSNWEAG